MAIPVLIIGKSGSGKSASLRNFKPEEIGVINVMGKPLPFKSTLKTGQTKSYETIDKWLKTSMPPSIVIDDAGYLITDYFMTRHSNFGAGNAVFQLYNELADKFYSLIDSIQHLPEDKIIYVMMHEDESESGNIKPKTIGKLLDEKVNIEGMFTIVLRCVSDKNRHVFLTQSSGFDVAKSPIGMFADLEIDNDLKMVDDAIRDFYNLKGIETK
jgi:hypothetical protein